MRLSERNLGRVESTNGNRFKRELVLRLGYGPRSLQDISDSDKLRVETQVCQG